MDVLSNNTSTLLFKEGIPNNMESSWSSNRWTPVYLSCLAGASTCLGAAVVFLHPKQQKSTSSFTTTQKQAAAVSNGTMSFSLALAGSVMITVSVVSIGGECLQNDVDGGFISLTSWLFWQRLLCFGIGCMVYLLLSKCAFPEPEEIIEQNSSLLKEGMLQSSSAVSSFSEGEDGDGSEKKNDDDDDDDDVESGGNEGVFSKGKNTETVEEVVLSSKHMKRNTTTVPSKRRNNNTNATTAKSTTASLISTSSSNMNDNNSTNISSSSSSSLSTSSVKSNFVAWTKGNDLQTTHQKRAWRLAMLLFLSLLLHNFPEGLAVAASALESPSLGITVTIGIMIHNIPEGIAIAIPCLAARPDRPWLSFLLASASGLAEPAGAFLALLCLEHLEPHSSSFPSGNGVEIVQEEGGGFWSLENVLAFVAGIMITVALWELFPEALKHSYSKTTTTVPNTTTTTTMSLEKQQQQQQQQQQVVQVVKREQTPFWCGTVLGVVIMLLTEFYTP